MKFLKEGLITLVVAIVLSLLVDLVGGFVVPVPSGGDIFSAGFMLISLVLLAVVFLVPAISAVVGGYLISKNGGNLVWALLVPAIAVAVAILLLMMVDIATLMLSSNEVIQAQLDEIGEFGVSYLQDMTIDEFKSFILISSLVGGIFIGAIYFALGLIGALAGRFIALGKL